MWFISKGRWIGFGDVKYCLGMGWLLGISGGFSALLLSFWMGALFGILLLLKGGLKNHQIPFAPFLVLGTLIAFLYNIDMGVISSLFVF
jgi:leader peptidase (prepilin peptidase)/N-methyltransferase